SRLVESANPSAPLLFTRFNRFLAKSSLKSSAIELADKIAATEFCSDEERLSALMAKGVLEWGKLDKSDAMSTFRTVASIATQKNIPSIAAAAEANLGLLALAYGEAADAELPLLSALTFFKSNSETVRYYSVAANLIQVYNVIGEP